MSELKTVSFFVPGDPVGQPRPRAFARKFGDKWQARVYDAGTAEGWKSAIAVAAKPHLTRFDDKVTVDMVFFFNRPKAHWRANYVLKPKAPRDHLSKPDCDNLAKAVLDALTVLGFWGDDKQVTKLCVSKQYVDFEWRPMQGPGASIVIWGPTLVRAPEQKVKPPEGEPKPDWDCTPELVKHYKEEIKKWNL